MSFDLTTREIVKRLDSALSESDNYDDNLDEIIKGVSADVVTFLNRDIEIKSRTEFFNVDNLQTRFRVKAYPITSVTTVDNDGTTIDSDDIKTQVEGDRGFINFDTFLTPGIEKLSITYVGGMAADTASFVLAFKDLAYEIARQIIFDFNKNKLITKESNEVRSAEEKFYKTEFTPALRKILSKYARRSFVA